MGLFKRIFGKSSKSGADSLKGGDGAADDIADGDADNTASSTTKRRHIHIENDLSELPEDVQQMLEATTLSSDQFMQHVSVLATILRFILKAKVTLGSSIVQRSQSSRENSTKSTSSRRRRRKQRSNRSHHGSEQDTRSQHGSVSPRAEQVAHEEAQHSTHGDADDDELIEETSINATVNTPASGNNASETATSTSTRVDANEPTEEAKKRAHTAEPLVRSTASLEHTLSEQIAKAGAALIEQAPVNKKKASKMFRSVELSGKGGFGRVFFARQNVKGKPIVAIKKMDNATKAQRRANICEIGCISALRHDAIVEFRSALRVDAEVWICMEFLEGGTLQQATKRHEFTEAECAYVLRTALDALIFLHEQEMAHRDLKSSNIMMTLNGIVKLIDFGLCMKAPQPPQLRRIVGSVHWMAPEMLRGERYGVAVDIWSLGICMLEMLCKQVVFDRGTRLDMLFSTAVHGIDYDDETMCASARQFADAALCIDAQQRATAKQLRAMALMDVAISAQQMATLLRSVFVQHQLVSALM